MADFRRQGAGCRGQISDFRWQISGGRFQVADFRWQVAGGRLQGRRVADCGFLLATPIVVLKLVHITRANE
jgi:hypothetical protein